MKYSTANKPLVCMQTTSTCYKSTREMKVLGVLWHSTGANNPTLKRYVQPSDNAVDKAEMLKLLGRNLYKNDWNHTDHKVGLNAWIGKLADGTVASIQTMPWDYRPWGCGSGTKGSCNNGFIQFEICEDNLKDESYFNQIYKEACELTAYLCKMFDIDPHGTVVVDGVKCPTILCHQDSHRLGLGSNHSDINHWFPKYGKSMATARNDVAALLKPAVTTTKPTTPISAFNVGDVVEIIGTTYYSGKAVPSWVRKKTWIVSTISGDRVVVNKSSDGKHSIMSPFKASSLALVTASKTETPKIETPKTETTTTTKPPATTTIPTTKIVKGTVVSIIKGAKYYNGATVPSWVRAKNWIVKETPNGDRVVIDKSVDGKNSICSAINSKYLTVVSGGSTPIITTTKPVTTTTATATIKKDSKVKVKSGAKTYTGGSLASFVYKTTYTVLEEPKGDRVVIGLNGKVTAAVNLKDLTLV